MDEQIKNKVREIQSKYCGESVETKLYYAIEETMNDIKLARECMDFKGLRCDNKDCTAGSCQDESKLCNDKCETHFHGMVTK